MRLLAVGHDLFFRSKVEAAAAAAGATVLAVPGAEALAGSLAGEAACLAVIDLELDAADPLQMVADIRTAWPSTPILGYCSHAKVELQGRARLAGCVWAGPRSGFLAALVQRLGARS